MRFVKSIFPLLFILAACSAPASVQVPTTATPKPVFSFPPTWTPTPQPAPSQTPTPATPGSSATPSAIPTATEFPFNQIASEIATRMANRPSPTPMQACRAIADVPGIPLKSAPLTQDIYGTMDVGEIYEITAWHPPLLYLSQEGVAAGWVAIPRPGLALEGSECAREGPADLEHLYGFPNVCLFLAIGGSEPPVLYQAPSLAADFSFNIIIGYFTSRAGDFYHVVLSEAGPSGYVHISTGQLFGDCPAGS
jgi:hypothetical protein